MSITEITETPPCQSLQGKYFLLHLPLLVAVSPHGSMAAKVQTSVLYQYNLHGVPFRVQLNNEKCSPSVGFQPRVWVFIIYRYLLRSVANFQIKMVTSSTSVSKLKMSPGLSAVNSEKS